MNQGTSNLTAFTLVFPAFAGGASGQDHRQQLVVIVPLFLLAGSALAQFGAIPEKAEKDGWWIKVSTEDPASQMMVFYIGATEKSYGLANIWNPGSPAEFDVSAEYRNSPTLYVLAQTTSGRKCGICLMYKQKCVKYLEFDLEESQEVKQYLLQAQIHSSRQP
ncbi:MAG: hypothetical protein JXR49_12530 [Acidobacteria bacterium]|nr:hypothetical protein [Acidobacteriota bacterium]